MFLSMPLLFSTALFPLPFFSSPLPLFFPPTLFALVLAWGGLRRKSSLASSQQTSHNQTLLQWQHKSSEAKMSTAQPPRAHWPQPGVTEGLWQMQHLGRLQVWGGRSPHIPTRRKGYQKGCRAHSGDTSPCQSFTLPTYIFSLLPKALLPKHSWLHTICTSSCHKFGLQKLNRFNPTSRIKTLPAGVLHFCLSLYYHVHFWVVCNVIRGN